MMKTNYENALKKNGKFVDTRSPVDFQKGTIPGAVNLVLRNISIIGSVCPVKTTPVIFFGPDATMAAQYAFGMGYTKVFYMENMPNLSTEKEKE